MDTTILTSQRRFTRNHRSERRSPSICECYLKYGFSQPSLYFFPIHLHPTHHSSSIYLKALSTLHSTHASTLPHPSPTHSTTVPLCVGTLPYHLYHPLITLHTATCTIIFHVQDIRVMLNISSRLGDFSNFHRFPV